MNFIPKTSRYYPGCSFFIDTEQDMVYLTDEAMIQVTQASREDLDEFVRHNGQNIQVQCVWVNGQKVETRLFSGLELLTFARTYNRLLFNQMLIRSSCGYLHQILDLDEPDSKGPKYPLPEGYSASGIANSYITAQREINQVRDDGIREYLTNALDEEFRSKLGITEATHV